MQRSHKQKLFDRTKDHHASLVASFARLFISTQDIPVCATMSLLDSVHKPLIGVIVIVPFGPGWIKEKETPVISDERVEQIKGKGCNAWLEEKQRL